MKTTLCMLALAILALVATPARAQGPYLYSLNSVGNVSVNGNKINNLTGSFNPSTPLQIPEQAWRDLAILDGNQYALRGDGLVVSNGVKLWNLTFTTNLWFWTQLQVSNGSFYQLRQDGKLAVNKDVVGTLPQTNFYFTSLQVVGGATYALRSDGNIYMNTSISPVFSFRAGNGLFGSADGLEADTLWTTLKQDPTGQYLYALRSDGVLYRGQLPSGTNDGALVTSFPFPSSTFTTGDLYTDFDFVDISGDWIVLRANGKVYREPNALTSTNNFPSGGTTAFYVDLAVFSNQFYVLRSDGRAYSQSPTTVLVKLPGSDYGRIELSADAPNLTGQKNIGPAVVQYTIPVNTDTPVKVPVIATDVGTPTANLIVTPVIVPPGAVWDTNSLVLTWTTPTNKGNYVFSYIVDDGGGSAKTYKSIIQVKLPDSDPAKNKPPYLPKINKAGALAGQEYRVYIPLNDPDGDAVTATVDTSTYPFNAGAQYNPATSEFIWTPTIADLGKKSAAFTLSDGTAIRKLNLKIQVNSPLFTPPSSD